MAIDSKFYIHESDRAALNALKSIPGFTAFLKAFMSVWNEKQFRILNMSSNLRLGENQMAKYYNMLPPICEKLGIPVPELYLELDVVPNAYTYGDTAPFIVLTSGLLETMPDELIPTVIAHECGHIACHHTLYHTMGRMILNGSANLPGLSSLISLPLQVAFFYWMRCSELSADRAATICDGHAENVIEMCMRFSGFDKDIQADVDKDLFLQQAVEYRELVNDSTWNKTLEFLVLGTRTHPANAVRAYEAREWAASDQYNALVSGKIFEADPTRLINQENTPFIQMPFDAKHYVGMNYMEAQMLLQSLGFTNITTVGTRDRALLSKHGNVTKITFAGRADIRQDTLLSADTPVAIFWYNANGTADPGSAFIVR